jgi:hypothetical protein
MVFNATFNNISVISRLAVSDRGYDRGHDRGYDRGHDGGYDRMVVELKLPVQSVPFTTNIVSSNPTHLKCTRYNIM